MFSRLRLTNFKNFADAHLLLGPLTLLVGTNASGKSNLREAFRFLHGVSRGYELAEILGEKWLEGGSLVWRGLRGGAREVVFHGGQRFGIEADLTDEGGYTVYQIDIEIDPKLKVPQMYAESLVDCEFQKDKSLKKTLLFFVRCQTQRAHGGLEPLRHRSHCSAKPGRAESSQRAQARR